MSDLIAERKNIESMIVNSKLWSPSREKTTEDSLTSIGGSARLNETFTSHVF